MSKKLIATNFSYFADLGALGRGPHIGSYLGRKQASLQTVKRFLRGNGTGRVWDVKLGSSYESRWIAK